METSQILLERTCDGDTVYTCPNGCSDGACLPAPATPMFTCGDNDPANSNTIKGYINVTNSTGGTVAHVEDFCPSASAPKVVDDSYCKAPSGTDISSLIGMQSSTCSGAFNCSAGICG